MPRYFFHLEDGQTLSDEDGEELMDDATARRIGVRLLADMLRARQERLADDAKLFVHVHREADRLFAMAATVQTFRSEPPEPG